MKYLPVLFILLATPAIAQQQPDPATLQRLLSAMQSQRNAALDQAALTQADVMRLTAEVDKLKAEIETLKQPPAK